MTKDLVVVTGEEFVRRVLEGERDFSGIRLEEGYDLGRHPELHDYLGAQRRMKKDPLIVTGSVFKGLKARDLEVHGMEAEGAEFEGASLEGAFLSGNFNNAEFRGDCNLNHAEFFMAQLANAGFYDIQMQGVRIANSGLKEATFRYAQLTNAHFDGCGMTRAAFRGDVALYNAVFERCNLGSASFSSYMTMNLRTCGGMNAATSFMECDLRKAFLGDKSIQVANFVGCKVTPEQKEKYDRLQGKERFVVGE